MQEGTQAVTILAAILAGIGVLLILTYMVLGAQRSYFLYLGLSLISGGAALFMTGGLRLIIAILTCGLLALALYEAVQESKNRWLQMQLQQRDREDAFSEVLEAQTRKEVQEEEERQARTAATEGDLGTEH